MKKKSLLPINDEDQMSSYDVQLLLAVLFLVGIGIVMVYSASGVLAMEKFHTDYYYLKRQSFFLLLGILALVGGRYFPYRIYRPLAYPLLILSIAMLAAVHLPSVGSEAGGAKRWLDFGFIKFQPSEVARLALVVYLAYSLEKKQRQIEQYSIGITPHLVVLAIFSLMLLSQPDFGSIVIFGAISFTMMFVAGARIKHLISTLLPSIGIAVCFMLKEKYRFNRILMFINPWDYASTTGYQTIHSLMAFGTGGIFGVGLGKGYQKLFYLPEPHTDFIFSVIGEELGMVGVMVIIALYAVIIHRGLAISAQAKDTFGGFLALGITTAIGLQVCINIGVTLGMLPPKGLTLPFLSYGGTSLLLNMAAVGILMNIDADKGKKEQE